MFNKQGPTWTSVLIVPIIILIIGSFCLVGYVKNIIGFISCDFDLPVKTEIIRGVGVVIPPVGIVCGYIELKDE